MGTPEFAVPVLKALYARGHEICAVVTQPDKPQGRRKTPMPSPVKMTATELGLDVLQFKRIRDDEPSRQLELLDADVSVTAAFGQILSQRNIDAARLGVVNAHASLLPAYRGPAPANWCIINGEMVTGVTSMHTDIGIDTGDIIIAKQLDIDGNTAGQLLERLSVLAAEVIIDTLDALENGTATRRKQDEAKASYHPMLKKTDGLIDFSKPAEQVKNLTLGVDPWPGAYVVSNGESIKLYAPSVADMAGKPGQLLDDGRMLIACGDKAVEFAEVQAPGKKRIPAADFLRGRKGFTGFDA